MGSVLVIAAIVSHPDPGAIAHGLFLPSPADERGGYGMLLLAMATVRAKGWRSVDHLKVQQRDLLFGVCTIFVVGALLQITAAGTLFGGPPPRDVSDLVRLFSPILEGFGRYVSGIGLWSAALGGTLAITAGGGMIVTDMCRNVLPSVRRIAGQPAPDRPVRKDPIYRAVMLFWFLTPLYVLFAPCLFSWCRPDFS